MRKEEMREAFEAWISSSPFEHDCKRNSMDARVTVLPGGYKRFETQLAWESWQQAWQAGRLDGRSEYYRDGYRAGWDAAERRN